MNARTFAVTILAALARLLPGTLLAVLTLASSAWAQLRVGAVGAE